jgi:hypothetical protein
MCGNGERVNEPSRSRLGNADMSSAQGDALTTLFGWTGRGGGREGPGRPIQGARRMPAGGTASSAPESHVSIRGRAARAHVHPFRAPARQPRLATGLRILDRTARTPCCHARPADTTKRRTGSTGVALVRVERSIGVEPTGACGPIRDRFPARGGGADPDRTERRHR